MVVSEATCQRKYVPNDQVMMSWWMGFAKNSDGDTGMMIIQKPTSRLTSSQEKP